MFLCCIGNEKGRWEWNGVSEVCWKMLKQVQDDGVGGTGRRFYLCSG
jgi:hypothetical protein